MTKMKNLLSSTLLLLASLLPMAAAADTVEVDGIYYYLNAGEAMVVSKDIEFDHDGLPVYYSDYSGDVVIPSSITYNGITYPVTAIGGHAFNRCYGLTSVTIGDAVTSIEYRAFTGCSRLTSVTFGNSVTTIGTEAFNECCSLKEVNIPNPVTTIGDQAFYQCEGLTSVTMSNSVTSIGNAAFYGCANLSDITLSNSITDCSSSAFTGTLWYDNQPDGVVYAGHILYKYTGEMPEGTSIIVDDQTFAIADEAFSGCNGLSSITIPNSVNAIGSGAFHNCGGLENITIPNSVSIIGSGAFYGTPWYDNQPDVYLILHPTNMDMLSHIAVA